MAEVKVLLQQVGPTTSESAMPRGHRAVVDRPEGKGGADQGPMGGEYFLTAVGGCFMSTLLAAVRARDLPITNVRTEVTVTIAENPPRFSSLSLQVSADCSDAEMLEHVVRVAEKGCIMLETLRHGIELDVGVGASV